ncbi:GGDEF domain-containing protein [Roseococcus pinisoli]|uniref:diguanylate cyclase n=1 Tax=Roseococcus pinisoli TaxID=2835040 RepID=A0ABS5QD67_9PROT|nr:diguanylate cyclase [Roseococcus pinisoli]MBS7811630.1 diguanylate cyclase [Roseococcus pinisoli]
MSNDDRPTILIADDERLNRNMLAELLQNDYRILLARDGADTLERARQDADRIALILLDVSMPGVSGYEVLAALRSQEQTAGISVIFITGQNSEADEEFGLRLGAADYIHKPIRPAILIARVRNLVNLALQKRELERVAQRDGLTGIANRRHFDEALDRACRHAARSFTTIGLALIDIDHFKLYNDRYGHVVGDQALRQVAQLLARHARRPYDVAARYGGEEFALLAPEGHGITELAEQFRRSVVDLRIPHAASTTAPVLTVSIGAAMIAGTSHDDFRLTLLEQADRLLYEAKLRGRNQLAHSAFALAGERGKQGV